MKISNELYQNGYTIGGEGRRIVIIDPEGKTFKEIVFCEGGHIIIMTESGYLWVNQIEEIKMESGLPVIVTE